MACHSAAPPLVGKVEREHRMSGRILVVEDNDSLRGGTQTQLQRCGYHSAVSATGAEALALLEKQPFDLVLADLNLPGMSGLELLSRISAEYPDISVVIITAYGTIETAVAAIRAGAYDYITKPVHPAD